jgi:hypothetical protein
MDVDEEGGGEAMHEIMVIQPGTTGFMNTKLVPVGTAPARGARRDRTERGGGNGDAAVRRGQGSDDGDGDDDDADEDGEHGNATAEVAEQAAGLDGAARRQILIGLAATGLSPKLHTELIPEFVTLQVALENLAAADALSDLGFARAFSMLAAVRGKDGVQWVGQQLVLDDYIVALGGTADEVGGLLVSLFAEFQVASEGQSNPPILCIHIGGHLAPLRREPSMWICRVFLGRFLKLW